MTAAELSPSARARQVLDDPAIAAAVDDLIERAPAVNAQQAALLRHTRLPVAAGARGRAA